MTSYAANRDHPLAYAGTTRPYHQVLRGPQYHWWRVVASAVMVLVGALTLYVGWSVVILAAGQLFPVIRRASSGGPHADAFTLLVTNALLACAIPLVLMATWAAHGFGPGWVASATGRFRWRWAALAGVVCLVVQVVGAAVMFALTVTPRGRGQDVALLVAIVLLTTPLQAAGEEYFFRGWLTQNLGALNPHRIAGLVISAAVSSGLFALAHGQQNGWLIGDRFIFGLVAALLVWRTGGLEASVALHAVNNIVVFIPVILAGSVHNTLTVTSTSAGLVALDLALLALTAGLVLVLQSRLDRRRRDPVRLV